MAERPLSEKREEMIEFLVDNIQGDTARHGNDIVIAPKGNTPAVYVKTLSRQSDLPIEFEADDRRFDTGRDLLWTATNDTIADFVREKNKEGFLPAFVLLRSEVTHERLIEDADSDRLNYGHFLKQATFNPLKAKEKPKFNTAHLDPLEVMLTQWHRARKGERSIKRQSRGNTYYQELTYYDSKKKRLLVVYFSDIVDPAQYKSSACPVCLKPNEDRNTGEVYDHESCKKTWSYKLDYAKDRDIARFYKHWWGVKKRSAADSRRKKEPQPEFREMKVDSRLVRMPGEHYRIAIIK